MKWLNRALKGRVRFEASFWRQGEEKQIRDWKSLFGGAQAQMRLGNLWWGQRVMQFSVSVCGQACMYTQACARVCTHTHYRRKEGAEEGRLLHHLSALVSGAMYAMGCKRLEGAGNWVVHREPGEKGKEARPGKHWKTKIKMEGKMDWWYLRGFPITFSP